MNTDDMKAGREMDILVAEKVMELIPCDKWTYSPMGPFAAFMNKNCDHVDGSCYDSKYPSKYSTDIAVVWQVVEHFMSMDQGITIRGLFNWECTIMGKNTNKIKWTEQYADTAPLAICRAALRVIEL